jgi:hypothetical protein
MSRELMHPEAVCGVPPSEARAPTRRASQHPQARVSTSYGTVLLAPRSGMLHRHDSPAASRQVAAVNDDPRVSLRTE